MSPIIPHMKNVRGEEKNIGHQSNRMAENVAVKLYNWDKRDGYSVPSSRNCYNSYFYIVEDNIDPVLRFYYQGTGFADQCSGGVALHNNLEEHLDAATYRKLMDVAVDAGCNYFTYNIRNTICNDCGYISKHTLDECPRCHSKHLDYATRVIGLTYQSPSAATLR